MIPKSPLVQIQLAAGETYALGGNRLSGVTDLAQRPGQPFARLADDVGSSPDIAPT